jgi:beta-glucosidase
MGYEFWPEALAATIRRAWAVTGGGVPVLVTENGIGTADDTDRIRFVERALRACSAASTTASTSRLQSLEPPRQLRVGLRLRADVRLVAVDRTTQARTPKPSAQWLGAVARMNVLP